MEDIRLENIDRDNLSEEVSVPLLILSLLSAPLGASIAWFSKRTYTSNTTKENQYA